MSSISAKIMKSMTYKSSFVFISPRRRWPGYASIKFSELQATKITHPICLTTQILRKLFFGTANSQIFKPPSFPWLYLTALWLPHFASPKFLETTLFQSPKAHPTRFSALRKFWHKIVIVVMWWKFPISPLHIPEQTKFFQDILLHCIFHFFQKKQITKHWHQDFRHSALKSEKNGIERMEKNLANNFGKAKIRCEVIWQSWITDYLYSKSKCKQDGRLAPAYFSPNYKYLINFCNRLKTKQLFWY